MKNKALLTKLLLSFLCVCILALSLTGISSITAYAATDDTGKAVQLGIGPITGYDATDGYHYLYYGVDGDSPIIWRVLDDKTNTGEDGLFLLTEYIFFDDNNSFLKFDPRVPTDTERFTNLWQGSYAQTYCNDFLTEKLSDTEQGALIATTKSDALYESISSSSTLRFAASENILNGDKMFFLSAEEVENAEYGFIDNASRIVDMGTTTASNYWLRSPVRFMGNGVGVVIGGDDGSVWYHVNNTISRARLAFNLNTGMVAFVESATGVQKSIGLFAVADYAGNEWKLNLTDSSRNFSVTESKLGGAPGTTLSIHYSGAVAGTNEYISALLTDQNGNVIYSGTLTAASESGVAEFTIPTELAVGQYTLNVFNEQANGDKMTDYVSEFAPVLITVELEHNFDATTHECACGATNHTFDELTHECVCGASNHSFVNSVCDCGAIEISATTFPDDVFRNYVAYTFDPDGNGILTAAELAAVTKIEYTDGTNRILDFTGLGYFTELAEFSMENQIAKKLDFSQNEKLSSVNCAYNYWLTELVFPSNSALTYLNLQACTSLASLDVSPCTALNYLNIEQCDDITSLDLRNNAVLTELYCYDNRMESIDLTNNVKLRILKVSYCGLTSLDLSQNMALEELQCRSNQLTNLDLSNHTQLHTVYCDNNNLLQLTLSPTAPIRSFDAGEQTATVTVTGNSLDLTRIDSSFDGSRATSMTTGAAFYGNSLVLINDVASVTYTYATGNGGHALEVTLTIEQIDYLAELNKLQTKLDEAVAALEEAMNGKATPADIQSAVNALTTAYQTADEAVKAALQGQIDGNADDIAALQATMTTADAALDAAIKQVASDLEAAMQNLQTQIDALKTGTDGSIADLDKALAALEKALSEMESAYQATDAMLDGRINTLADEDTAIKDSITKLEEAFAASEKTLTDAVSAVQDNLDKAVEALNQAIAKNQADLSLEIEALNTALQSAKALTESKLSELADEDTAIKDSITKLEEAFGASEKTLTDAVNAVQDNLDKAVESLNQAIAKNQADLSLEIEALNTALQSVKALTESKLSELADEDSAIKDSITALEATLNNTKTELKTVIDTVAANLAAAKSELETAITVGDRSLDEKLTAVEQAYKAADAVINGKIAEFTSEDQGLKESLTALETTLAGVKGDLETAIADLRRDLEDAKAALSAKDDELDGTITVLIVLVSIVGLISVGSAIVIVITLVKKRRG